MRYIIDGFSIGEGFMVMNQVIDMVTTKWHFLVRPMPATHFHLLYRQALKHVGYYPKLPAT